MVLKDKNFEFENNSYVLNRCAFHGSVKGASGSACEPMSPECRSFFLEAAR